MKIKVNHFLESIVFSYEMGLTVSQWAGVELSLGEVVSCFFHDKSIRASFIGFHSIQNFQTKLAYADNVLKSHIKIKSDLKKWIALYKRLDSVSKSRNHLAHFTQIVDTGSTPGRTYQLQNWDPKSDKTSKIHLQDVVQIRYDMFALNLSLQNYALFLRDENPKYEKTSETPMKAPKGIEIIKQFQEVITPML